MQSISIALTVTTHGTWWVMFVMLSSQTTEMIAGVSATTVALMY